MWCVMFRSWFFVRSWLYELRGDQKHPIWVISDLFNDIPKSIPGGSCMYTISCKASYLYNVLVELFFLEKTLKQELQKWQKGPKGTWLSCPSSPPHPPPSFPTAEGLEGLTTLPTFMWGPVGQALALASFFPQVLK